MRIATISEDDSQQSSRLHLHLHGPAPLERSPAPNNQSQIVRPELRVALGRVGVGVSRARENGAALDARLKPLLAEREPLELVEAVAFRRAVHEGVLEEHLPTAAVVDRRLRRIGTVIALPRRRRLFQLPGVAALVVQEARVVVALVEVFENGGEDFGEGVGQVDPFGGGLEELAAADGGEER